MQARMFAGLTAFAVVAGVGYGVLTGEPAGTTLLLLTGGLTGLCGLYISWNRRPSPAGTHRGSTDGSTGTDHATLADAHTHGIEEPWFPHASPWPFAIAVSVALAANAMLLGIWLLLPAVVLLAAAVFGFAAQSRHRN
jgi:hypothetical protein